MSPIYNIALTQQTHKMKPLSFKEKISFLTHYLRSRIGFNLWEKHIRRTKSQAGMSILIKFLCCKIYLNLNY